MNIASPDHPAFASPRVGTSAPFWSGFVGGIAFAALFAGCALFMAGTVDSPLAIQRTGEEVPADPSDTTDLEHALTTLKAQNHELQEENAVLRTKLDGLTRDASGE